VTQRTAGPVQGYQALTATGSTRTDTPVERIPASIGVIPRSIIDDLNSLSVAEATRNVNGVQATNPLQTLAYDGIRIRGLRGEQWLDGITTYYNAGNRDSLVNVERIEVLKGTNAILYGGGSGAPLGGAINVVSKLPTDKAFNEFGSTFGSYHFLQPYFDTNQPLTKDGTILARTTGECTTSGSFRHDRHQSLFDQSDTRFYRQIRHDPHDRRFSFEASKRVAHRNSIDRSFAIKGVQRKMNASHQSRQNSKTGIQPGGHSCQIATLSRESGFSADHAATPSRTGASTGSMSPA